MALLLDAFNTVKVVVFFVFADNATEIDPLKFFCEVGWGIYSSRISHSQSWRFLRDLFDGIGCKSYDFSIHFNIILLKIGAVGSFKL
jgi:hypothetical protein